MPQVSPAERLLQDLGVTDARDIDLEAIAWHVGVRIKYRHLDGCEARIAGDDKKAIISVRDDVSPGRQRFSIGHELGHWHYHRGRTLICRPEDIGQGSRNKPETERTADNYAADLLMPAYLFRKEAQRMRSLTWEGVRHLADLFSSSVTATAIRVLDLDVFPAILVCHGVAGRKWFWRARSVPDRWFPQAELSAESYALDVLYGKRVGHAPVLMDAEAWFDRREAYSLQLHEQSIQVFSNEVLTLLVPKDDEMLDDLESHSSSRW